MAAPQKNNEEYVKMTADEFLAAELQETLSVSKPESSKAQVEMLERFTQTLSDEESSDDSYFTDADTEVKGFNLLSNIDDHDYDTDSIPEEDFDEEDVEGEEEEEEDEDEDEDDSDYSIEEYSNSEDEQQQTLAEAFDIYFHEVCIDNNELIMATDADNKKLSDLRVVDLRAELEKRGLDKTGVKASLIERLQKALVSEGKNPDEYEFELCDKKPLKRLSTSNRSEEHTETSVDQSANDSVLIETQAHDVALEVIPESNQDKKSEATGAESPLNLSIGEEEEHLLLNSGDEESISGSPKKLVDEKTAASNVGPSTDSVKEVDSTTSTATMIKVPNDVKEDDDIDLSGEHNSQGDDDTIDEPASPKLDDSTSANETSTTSGGGTGAGATQASSSNSTTAPSNKENGKNDKNKNGKSNPGRSLWVTNLLPSTRAQELKHLLSRYGKVIGAKVVQSSRFPRTRCYGYVTMETRAAADVCIEKLNNTELKGQIIRVAKVRPEHSLPLTKAQKKTDSAEKSKKKTPPKTSKSASLDKQSTDKKKNTSTSSSNTTSSEKTKKDDKSKKDSEGERNHSRSSSRKNRSLSKTSARPERKTDILTFDKIREERERQRQRERERALREEEKRRRELQRAREIEKRQREEAMRLEREREKLRIERERLDRQRVEIMRLERERQKLEREKLEQEKQELRRQQLRLEEARRPVKRPSTTTSANYRRDSASYPDERKRLATERHYEETPPPPRFEVSSREPAVEIPKSKEIPKDYKSRMAYSKRTEEYSKRSEFKREFPPAERHTSGHPAHLVHNISSSGNASKYDSSYANREREREIREPGRREPIVPNVPPPRISKETRYTERSGERSPVSYRPVRDEREQRRPVSDHHAKSDIRSSRDHRYGDVAPSIKDAARYRESNSWHTSGASPVKPFSGMSSSANSSRESWSKADNWRPMEAASNERWGTSSSRILMSGSSGVPSNLYSGGNSNISGMSTGLSCPPPPGNSSYALDRFDSYKSLNNSRKY